MINKNRIVESAKKGKPTGHDEPCMQHWLTVEYEIDYLKCTRLEWYKAGDDHYQRTQIVNPVTGKRSLSGYTMKWIYCICENKDASLLPQDFIDKEIEKLEGMCVSPDNCLCWIIYFRDGNKIKRACRVCDYEQDYKELT